MIIDKDLEQIKSILESKDPKAEINKYYPEEYKKYFTEQTKALNEYRLLPVLVVTAIIIGYVIEKLIKWIKEHKQKDVTELTANLKKLDDKFVKANAFFSFGSNEAKVKKFEKTDCEIRSIVLKDKDNPSKFYKLSLDFLAYNPEYVTKSLEDCFRYCETLDADAKAAHLKLYREQNLQTIYNSFMNKHWYILSTEPYCKSSMYNNIRVGEVLKTYKSWIDWIHDALKAYNEALQAQLQYLQLCNQAYNNLTNKYGKEKEYKDTIDAIFKTCIKNTELSLEFNNKAFIILNDMVKFYTESLDALIEKYKK